MRRAFTLEGTPEPYRVYIVAGPQLRTNERVRVVEQQPGTEGERLRYRCPNGHDWWTTAGDVPLVNIKCPNCAATAFQLKQGVPAPRWQVEPLRTIEADVPAVPPEGGR